MGGLDAAAAGFAIPGEELEGDHWKPGKKVSMGIMEFSAFINNQGYCIVPPTAFATSLATP
jgi:hypothetical protein